MMEWGRMAFMPPRPRWQDVVWRVCELELGAESADLVEVEIVTGLDELVGVEMGVCAVIVHNHGVRAAAVFIRRATALWRVAGLVVALIA